MILYPSSMFFNSLLFNVCKIYPTSWYPLKFEFAKHFKLLHFSNGLLQINIKMHHNNSPVSPVFPHSKKQNWMNPQINTYLESQYLFAYTVLIINEKKEYR